MKALFGQKFYENQKIMVLLVWFGCVKANMVWPKYDPIPRYFNWLENGNEPRDGLVSCLEMVKKLVQRNDVLGVINSVIQKKTINKEVAGYL